MEIQILKENLVKAVSAANKFTSNRMQMPILSYVLIEATDTGIYLTSTNLEVGLRIRVAGKILANGSTAVSAEILTELVQHLPLGGVSIKLSDQGLKIQSGKVRARLQALPPEDFPPFPKEAGKTGIIKVEDFTKSFESVGFAVSTDEARPVLTGFLWLIDKHELVATDGYRLSMMSKISAWEVDKKIDQLLVPGKAVSQLLQLLGDFGVEKCDFYYDIKSQQLLFNNSEMSVSIRILAGDYPQYEAILPKGSDLEISVSREELLEAVRAAAIFARDSANIIRLAVKPNLLEVSANAAQVGENTVGVEAEIIKGSEISIAFNSKYLVDFLTHSQAEKINISLTDPLKPGLFLEAGNDEYKHVIMPVRVRE